MHTLIGDDSTLLVVEDDAALREMYRAALTAAGYTVIAVEDGIDALREVQFTRPDLIVLDLVLPRLGGYDLQRELASHAETRDIPIVVVTGVDSRVLKRTDFDCVFTKPVNVDALVAAVRHLLRRDMDRQAAGGVGGQVPPTGHRWSLPQAPRPKHEPRTILVVDDERPVQILLRHFLEDEGFPVETAGGVGEAISVLERGSIAAIVLDVRMPQRSGLELLEFVRLDPALRDLPVFVLTGATLTPDEEATIAVDRGQLFYKSDNLDALVFQLLSETSSRR
jgi:twitching motility two-component system response regulator PilH